MILNNLRRFISKSAITTRVLGSFSNSDKFVEYLTQHGITNNKTIEGISKTYGGKVSLGDLKALGEPGLKALVAIVDREVAKEEQFVKAGGSLDPIKINIAIPHERSHMVLEARENETFYELVQKNPELEVYLACPCGGLAACSTCHVIISDEHFSKIPAADESELDMLDLAWGVQETSRLGCQIKFTRDLEGLQVTVPEQSNNLF